MREYGYGYAIIGWVSEAEMFYRKAVGAEFIKAGNPENSVYSNLVFMWLNFSETEDAQSLKGFNWMKNNLSIKKLLTIRSKYGTVKRTYVRYIDFYKGRQNEKLYSGLCKKQLWSGRNVL